MTIRTFEWSYPVSLQTLGYDPNSRAGRNRIANQIIQITRGPASRRSQPTPSNLQTYIDRYGEQVTVDASADLGKYFQVTQGRGYTVGGLSTQLPPLSASPGDVRPSNSAISVIGEGLAGWYLTQQSLLPLARPIGEGVDLIFLEPTSTPRRYALIQVKATQQQNVVNQMKNSIPDLLQYGYNVAALASPGTFSCYVMGVVIRQFSDFDLLSLKMEFV